MRRCQTSWKVQQNLWNIYNFHLFASQNICSPMLPYTSYPDFTRSRRIRNAFVNTFPACICSRGVYIGSFDLLRSSFLFSLLQTSAVRPPSLLSKQYSFTLLWHCCSARGHGQCFQTRDGCEIIAPWLHPLSLCLLSSSSSLTLSALLSRCFHSLGPVSCAVATATRPDPRQADFLAFTCASPTMHCTLSNVVYSEIRNKELSLIYKWLSELSLRDFFSRFFVL